MNGYLTNQPIQQPMDKKSSYKKGVIFAEILGFLILFLAAVLLLDQFQVISLSRLFSTKNKSTNILKTIPIPTDIAPTYADPQLEKKSEDIIAKAGSETIYKKDLDTELLYSPPMKNVDIKKLLLDKIIKDSIILQGAAEDKFTTLDSTVFNSPQKNYAKRIELVQEVKKAVEAQADSISGTIVTIWFYNNNWIGPHGYEKSKEIAYQKISSFHNDVKSGKITIDQIADLIRKDTSLAELDVAYKSNVPFDFTLHKGQKVTFDENFSKAVWNLKAGEISDIYALVDNNTPKGAVAVLYAFAQVKEKKMLGSYNSYEEWIKEKQNKYEIIYY